MLSLQLAATQRPVRNTKEENQCSVLYIDINAIELNCKAWQLF
jgi:hypothetical protein